MEGDYRFYKLQSLGSDVILIDHCGLAPDAPRPDYGKLALAMLKRRRGVGGMALAVLEAAAEGGLRVRAWGADGRERQDSYDAFVCAARYLFDSGKAEAEKVEFLTREGKRELQVITSGSFRLSLGKPLDPAGKKPVDGPEGLRRTVLETETRRLSVCSVALPRVHAVLFSAEGTRAELEALEQALSALGKRGAQVNAVVARAVSRDTLMIRPSTRSSFDGIQATAAALAASAAAGFTDREAAVIHGPGIRYADWDAASGEISVTAGAEYVFEGTWSGVIGDPEGS